MLLLYALLHSLKNSKALYSKYPFRDNCILYTSIL